MSRPNWDGVVQIQHVFERTVDMFPNNTALVCDEVSLSYQELDSRANQLAHYLLNQGLTATNVVGLLLERSKESYIAILAVLKIGATYVPIETDYPDERINYIFSDMRFHAAIVSSAQSKRRGIRFPASIVLEAVQETLDRQPTARPVLEKTPDMGERLCYVIYTSGSTGKPKGVEITHRNILHYIGEASKLYDMTAEDRVYQGFSLAFDASLEEVWMAFANGGVLIACTSKDTRSGVGLIDFLQHHRISFFSTVPTLLSTLEGELPSLRILILGGEACTLNLINRFSRPGLRILNTYGPTEATVISTYSECYPDTPVTIGRPLPGYETVILDANLQPVADGDEGELCIGGQGVARGYVNRPELTANKFVINPNNQEQRLYRTGDLAMVTASGDLQFLGRVDDQVKLRGHRIELNEIETVIMEYGAIAQAVVALQELESPTLVAYLLLDKNRHFDLEQFKIFLDEKLPRFMIPPYLEIVESYPLLQSGKVDRKALQKPKKIVRQERFVAPTTEIEKKICVVWELNLQQDAISIEADFFYDLGGHSLLAAKIVSSLRSIPGMESISMLDLYQNPTIRQLAKKCKRVTASSKTHPPKDKAKENNAEPLWRYYLCGIGQFFGVLCQGAISAWQLLLVILCYAWTSDHGVFFSWSSLTLFLLLFLGMPVASLVLTITVKWLLLGRVRPGKYRLWGWFYLRWWLVERLQKNVFCPKYLIGSPLIILYYRLLGAKIGKNCYLGSVNIATLDTLEIGDNTSIGYDARSLGYVVEDGWLKIGRVIIGNNCFIGSRSVVSIDTQMEDDSALDDMSMLPRYGIIPRGQFFSGSPAYRSIAPANHVTKQPTTQSEPSSIQNVVFGVFHYLCLTFAMMVYYLCYAPSIMLVSYFYEHHHYLATIFFATPLAAVVFLSIYFTAIFFVKKVVMAKIKPGVYSLQSFYYLRQWTIVKMLDIDEIYVMADSLYFPLFLRLLGAKIGKYVEMGEVPHAIPDLITIQDGGFTASAVAFAWPNVHKGSISFASAAVGKRGFIGNMSMLPLGAQLGDGALLGCMSITPPNNKAAHENTAWLGSPAVFLPKRELFSGYSEKETMRPPKHLYVLRLIIECARIILPTMFSLILLFNMLYALDYLLGNTSILTTFLVMPLVEVSIATGLVAILVGLKWLILGKLRPGVKPIWNLFIWKNDVIEYANLYFVNPHFTNLILGTPFVSFLFRCWGAKIGKHVFIDTADFSEFDLISIHDNVCINSEVILQTHLYEDRIFKMSTVEVKEGCNVGTASIVLYNTVMEPNATLGNFSLLMKGETLPANTHWEGTPAQAVDSAVEYDDLLQQEHVAGDTPIELDAIK